MGKKSKKNRKAAKSVRPPSIQGSVESLEFCVGDNVMLQNLKSFGYNGKRGTISSLPKSEDGRYGVLVEGAENPVAVRPQNICFDGATLSGKSTQQMREEQERLRKYTEPPKSQSADADQLGLMRMMTNMLLTDEAQMKIYGRKIDPIPNFLNEMRGENKSFPAGVDSSWAEQYLRMSFENASSNPHNFEVYFKRKNYDPEAHDYLKRLGSNEPAKLDWYFGGNEFGSIFPQRVGHSYSDTVRHSFSNQAYRQEKLWLGTTHVAVGFVDLGMLFAAELLDAPMGRGGPLNFVGIEMSAYAVAKSQVIWEMMKQTPVATTKYAEHLRYIAQAWFSAAWENGTERAVKSALSTLCSSGQSQHPSVRLILYHWSQAPPFPLVKARAQLSEVTTDKLSSLGHLLKKRDRMAMAKYELGRDFCINGKPACGNTLMFDCPDGTPPLDFDETVYSSFAFDKIMKIVLQNESSRMTIVDATETHALDGVGKVASWAVSGKVVVELKCAPVQKQLEDIASRKPWTMSWSNVCDYVDYSDFHRMARRCSIHGDTIHFGYSMNWVREILGAFIIDFPGPEHAELRVSIIDNSNKSVDEVYKHLGWERHLRSPPPDNPINTTTAYGLKFLQSEKWSDHFFGLALKEGSCQVAQVEHALVPPLSPTGGNTLAFTWTYDPKLKLHAESRE